jgi:aspartokinase
LEWRYPDLTPIRCPLPFLDDALETKAAYRESRIKTYGFQRMTGLSLVRITVHRSETESLGQAFCRLGEEGIGFLLVFSQCRGQAMEVCLVVTAERVGVVEERLEEFLAGTDRLVRPGVPSEMVFFQGPHFGDRYGILEAAVRGLAARRVKMTAAACSGSCIYIVLPEGKSEEAVATLSEMFEIPRASSLKLSTTCR